MSVMLISVKIYKTVRTFQLNEKNKWINNFYLMFQEFSQNLKINIDLIENYKCFFFFAAYMK